MSEHEEEKAGVVRSILGELPTDRLVSEVESFLGAAAQRAMAEAIGRVGSATGRMAGYAERGGGPVGQVAAAGARAASQGKSPLPGLMRAGLAGLTGVVTKSLAGGGSGGGGGGGKLKLTNIVEQIDVGVPRAVVYNQWTQFADFPQFTKKVESVRQEEDEKLTWTAQVLWSHRTWKSTIVDQVPDQRIVWESEGDKGYVDGTVTFHELTPDLTRVLLVLEYHSKGFFEGTGNLWRAQGRRVRLELKHFRRHVMREVLLHPDDVEGWRGEIHDGEVAETSDRGRDDEDEDKYEDESEYDDRDDKEDEDKDEVEDEYDDRDDKEDEDRDEYDDRDEDDRDEPAAKGEPDRGRENGRGERPRRQRRAAAGRR